MIVQRSNPAGTADPVTSSGSPFSPTSVGGSPSRGGAPVRDRPGQTTATATATPTGQRRGTGPRKTSGGHVASGFGWFSIGLGVAQLLAPGMVNRVVGAPNTADARALLRIVGIRELGTAAGILSQSQPTGWLWGRVAGDLMDLAILGTTFGEHKADRTRLALATASVVGVLGLDAYRAIQATRNAGRGAPPSPIAGVETRKTITIDRPPAEVYRAWRDIESLPRFMRQLESVRDLGGGRSRWRAVGPAGSTVEWDAEIVQDRPGDVIAWRSLPGSRVETSGRVQFIPAPGGRGTEVHVTLAYRPPAGALGATLAKLFNADPSQQVPEDLRRFKQVVETGDVVYSDATIHGKPHPARPSGQVAPAPRAG